MTDETHSETKSVRVAGVAYRGGKMRLQGWKYPVIVDLDGLAVPDSVPLLVNHENRTDSRVGSVRAVIRDGVLEIEGEITADTPEAVNIAGQAKKGAAWQLSIGADVIRQELETVSARAVNGELREPPFYHVRRSSLREVSVVAVGADAGTNMNIAASFRLDTADAAWEQQEETQTKENIMNSLNSQKNAEGFNGGKTDAAEAVLAERARVTAIRNICGGEFPDIERDAVADGRSPDETARAVLEAMRGKRPSASTEIRGWNGGTGQPPDPRREMRGVLEAALCLRSGMSADELEHDYGARAVEAGLKEMDMPLKQLLAECLRMDGVSCGRGFDNDTIRAAFSTVSLPGILSGAANKKLLKSFESQPVIATKLCSTGDLSDFKESERFRLTDVGDLLPVAQDGEIKDGGLLEESAKNQLETYGKKFCLTRKMIINDDLGAFMKVPAAMGLRAAHLIDQLFFSRLMSNPAQGDGRALFHSSHRNLLTGAASALSADSLKKAVQMFLDQTDADGQPVFAEPKYLLVPTALKHTALELTRGTTMIMSGSTDAVRPAINVLADEDLIVKSSPYLGNSLYSGASQTAWYLFGDPSVVDTFELGFLRGRRTPVIERGETDFNTLGVWFRVYFDIGVREQDFRGMVKASGQA